MNSSESSAAARYQALAAERQVFLNRAEDCVRYTIPALLPRDGHSAATNLYRPFQSLGARGVNNLASKLLLSLLPTSSAFFRFLPDLKVEQALKNVEAENSPESKELRDKIEEALSTAEQRVLRKIESIGLRVHVFEALKHLLATGNGLLYIGKNGTRFFPMNQYVVRRNPSNGEPLEIIVKEKVAREILPDSAKAALKVQDGDQSDSEVAKVHDLYTIIRRDGDKYRWHQEVGGTIVEGTESQTPLDKLPWLPLRLVRIPGEDWGRGLAEEYIGDLIALENLSKALTEGSALAARIIFRLSPNAVLNAKTMSETSNGGFVTGNPGDVEVIQLNKSLDLQVTYQQAGAIEQRLSAAFLLNSSVQRNAERVTAEEVRYVANELENALGGVYSVLSIELQLPIVRLVMAELTRQNLLPPLPEGYVEPTIVTGLDALGRNNELMRLDSFIGGVVGNFGPSALTYLNVSTYLTRRATALGVDTKNLIRSQEEVIQEQQEARMTEIASKAAPNAVKALSDHALANQPQEVNG